MLKFALFVTFSTLLLVNYGSSLECYKVTEADQAPKPPTVTKDEHGNSVHLLGQPNTGDLPLKKVTCQEHEKCYTVRREAGPGIHPFVTYEKGCTATEDICEKKYAEDKASEAAFYAGRTTREGYGTSQFYCSYCETDLCNDVDHNKRTQ